MNIKSRVNFVKTKMADRHLTQPVKDVSISTLLDRDVPITTLMLCEVYPDAQLNTTTMTWALYTFTISTLMDVWTTWGVKTTRYCRRELLHHLRLLDVPGRSNTNYSGAEVTSAIWPSPSPASKMFLDVSSQLSTSGTIYSGAESSWPSPSPASS